MRVPHLTPATPDLVATPEGLPILGIRVILDRTLRKDTQHKVVTRDTIKEDTRIEVDTQIKVTIYCLVCPI